MTMTMDPEQTTTAPQGCTIDCPVCPEWCHLHGQPHPTDGPDRYGDLWVWHELGEPVVVTTDKNARNPRLRIRRRDQLGSDGIWATQARSFIRRVDAPAWVQFETGHGHGWEIYTAREASALSKAFATAARELRKLPKTTVKDWDEHFFELWGAPPATDTETRTPNELSRVVRR